jgi:hypothetical protein
MCAATLAGCDHSHHGAALQSGSAPPNRVSRVSVPLPAPALLVSSVEPDCEFRTTDPNADERQRLDYERQCYRHAEIIMRERLKRLQNSVRKTARAINHCQRSATSGCILVPFDVAGD